jgi:ATP-binding cassette subfamily F protein 3
VLKVPPCVTPPWREDQAFLHTALKNVGYRERGYSPMINVKELAKSFGKQILFEDASFTIGDGEKIGLVGRNGHGKSTFFKILIGEEEADSGTIEVPKGYTLAHVSQHLTFSQPTVIEEASLFLDSPDESWKAEKILMGLGFSVDDFSRSPLDFSGGYQVRINLAKTLLTEPDLLLLDEPTNYLDISSIRWLVDFLKKWKSSLLLITHDRSVMDSVITHTLAIHRQKIRKIEGNTEKMYQQIIKDEEIYEKTRINDEKKKKEIEDYVTRFRAKARIASRVKSREKLLDKFEQRDKLAQIDELDFSFNEAPFEAKILLTVEDLTFGYTEKNLIEKLSFFVGKNDRICIIGKNGKGKTTLLKLLFNKLEPKSGTMTFHPQSLTGYFEQTNVSSLDPERTVDSEIAEGVSPEEATKSRNIAGAMMFREDDALKKIKVLSGGEKARVMLGKILIKKHNLLLLDEPTNHLDMQSSDSLLEAIDSFNGGVVMVTHNEMFLRALATRLIVFRNNDILVHEGNYDSFLEKYGWEDEEEAPKEKDNGEKKIVNKKELRKLRAEIQQEKTKVLGPLKKKIEKLESDIEKSEALLTEMNQQMTDAAQNGESSRIQELSKEIHTTTARVDELYTDLEESTESAEAKEEEFDLRLRELIDE